MQVVDTFNRHYCYHMLSLIFPGEAQCDSKSLFFFFTNGSIAVVLFGNLGIVLKMPVNCAANAL